MTSDLDSKINQLFRELEDLKAKGESGKFIEHVGWVGTSPKYEQLLKELSVLTQQRLQLFHTSNSLRELT